MLETLKMGVKKFFDFIKPRKRVGVVSFIILLTSTVFCFAIFASPVGAWDIIVQGLASLFSEIILFFAGLFIQLAIFFLKFVIEIAAYNDFINSTPVLLGWTLVRDIANMFFVVILLIIAFATVLGLENYSWKKLLMKFVLAAILVNFSRVICGVIIDAAQVFMMTFVNGVAATAGGNLVQALSLNKMLSWSSGVDPEQIKTSTVIGTAIAASFFAALAAFTIGAYLFMLLTRAVVLWVLIILSPLAFVLNVIPKTQGYASKWWTTFGNEVVAGPVMIFFLWLSFAVAGTGVLHQEIDTAVNEVNPSYSLSGAAETIKTETEAVKNDKLALGGLGEILEWEQMASFIISISLLLVGVKITKELSTVGGGIMGGMVDFGKKAAMMATGIAATRYLAQGAKEGVIKGAAGTAKFLAMKAPLGGEFWQNQATAVKGRVKGRLAEWGTSRDMWVSGWEKKKGYGTEGTALSRAFFRTAGRVLQTGARARKRAESWSEGAERLEQVHDVYMSTSATEAGKFKDQASTQLAQAEEFKSAKIAQKSAENMMKWKESERGREREELTISSKVAGEAAKALLESEEKAELAEAKEAKMEAWQKKTPEELRAMSPKEREKYEAEYPAKMQKAAEFAAEAKILGLNEEARRAIRERDAMDRFKVTEEGQKQIGKIAGLKAEGDYRVLESDRSTAAAMAEARDKYWQEQGKAGGFLRAELAKQNKEEFERLNVSSYDQSKAQAQNAGDRMADITQRLENGKISPEDANKELGKIQQLAGNMAMSNFNRGSLFGLDTMYEFLKRSGIGSYDVSAAAETEDEQQMNFLKTQANVLSYFSGKKVELKDGDIGESKKAIEETMKSLQTSRNDIFMEQMAAAVATTAQDAAVNYAGLFKEKLDPATGKVKVEALDWKANANEILPKREYALSRSKLGKEGMSGSVDRIKGDTRIKSEEALRHLGSMVESLTATNYNNMDKNAVNDIASAIINAHSAAEAEFQKDPSKFGGDKKNAIAQAEAEVKKIVDTLGRSIKNFGGFESLIAGVKKSLTYKGHDELKLDTSKAFDQKSYQKEYGHKAEDEEKEKEAAAKQTKQRDLTQEESAHFDEVFNRLAEVFKSAVSQNNPAFDSAAVKAIKDLTEQLKQGTEKDSGKAVTEILENLKTQASASGVTISEEKLAEEIGKAVQKAILEAEEIKRIKSANPEGS